MLHLYTVHTLHLLAVAVVPPARSLPAARRSCSLSVLAGARRAARSAVHVLRPDRFQPLAVRAARSARCPCGRVAVLACPRPCVRLLMPGQRWTFLSAVPVWPALLARFPCACGRARARVCVGAVRLPSSRLPCILFAYNVHSPPLCQACPPRFRPAANFFEIVFKLSISVQLSSAGMGDAS